MELYSAIKQLYLAESSNNTEYTICVQFRNFVGQTDPVCDSILYLIEEEPLSLPPDWFLILVIVSIIEGSVVVVIITYRIIKSRRGIEIIGT